VVLVKYNYQAAKSGALYESTNGSAAQPTDNPGNSDGLGISIELYPNRRIRCIADQVQQFGNSSVPIRT
jgi:hypothetical protein